MQRSPRGIALPAALALLALAGPAGAAQLRVPEDYPSVAAGLAAAAYGDTVSLAPGSYGEAGLVWPRGRAILGRSGDPEDTVIDAGFKGRVLGGSDLDGANELGYLTLRNGQGPGPYGSGLMVVGDPHLHDLIIEYCTANGPLYGIGLYARGSARIVDCLLRHNRSSATGTEGGGAWLMGTPAAGGHTVQNLEVHDNEAFHASGIHFNNLYGFFTGLYCHDNVGDGMVVYNGSINGTGPTVEYSLFAGNTGSGLAYDADLILSSCTFVGNGSSGAAPAAIDGGSSWDFTLEPHITQCIVAYNRGPGMRGLPQTPYTIDCNDVFGNAGGNYAALPDLDGIDGNISLDPQFCGQGDRPYGLEEDSPCAEENNDCGLLLGAYAVNCPDAGFTRTSWGALKVLYSGEPKAEPER